jgi:ribosomal protein L32
MALPKRRKSHARVRTRRQQWTAKNVTTTTCPHCSATSLPHRVCTALRLLQWPPDSAAENQADSGLRS